MARLSHVLIAAAAALLGLTGPAAVQAAGVAAPHHPVRARPVGSLPASAIVPHHPPIHVLNAAMMHAAFEKALKSHPRIGNIAYARPRGYKGPAAKTAAGCTPPDCPLSYGGGPVQVSGGDVYLVFWGPNWSSNAPDTTYISNFFSGLGTTSDRWLPITQQYTQNGCCDEEIQLGKSILSSPGGIFSDTSTPPSTVTGEDMVAEVQALHASGALGSPPNDALVILAAQSGTCFSDGFAGQPASCATQPSKGYCAWHSQTSSAGSPGNDYPFINLPYQPDAGAYCDENLINSGSAGTYDWFSIFGGHELAESFTDPLSASGWTVPVGGSEIADICLAPPGGDISLSTGRFAVQPLWSNADNKCMLLNDLQTGYVSGIQNMCPDDTLGSLADGNKVQVWRCNGNSNQVWSTPEKGKTGEVILHATGSCLDVTNDNNTSGTKVQLWKCVNDASQQWTPESNGTFEHAGFCLDDPNGTTTGGTQLQIWTCNGKSQQQWSPGHQ
jgi:hypothetical protein